MVTSVAVCRRSFSTRGHSHGDPRSREVRAERQGKSSPDLPCVAKPRVRPTLTPRPSRGSLPGCESPMRTGSNPGLPSDERAHPGPRRRRHARAPRGVRPLGQPARRRHREHALLRRLRVPAAAARPAAADRTAGRWLRPAVERTGGRRWEGLAPAPAGTAGPVLALRRHPPDRNGRHVSLRSHLGPLAVPTTTSEPAHRAAQGGHDRSTPPGRPHPPGGRKRKNRALCAPSLAALSAARGCRLDVSQRKSFSYLAGPHRIGADRLGLSGSRSASIGQIWTDTVRSDHNSCICR